MVWDKSRKVSKAKRTVCSRFQGGGGVENFFFFFLFKPAVYDGVVKKKKTQRATVMSRGWTARRVPSRITGLLNWLGGVCTRVIHSAAMSEGKDPHVQLDWAVQDTVRDHSRRPRDCVLYTFSIFYFQSLLGMFVT